MSDELKTLGERAARKIQAYFNCAECNVYSKGRESVMADLIDKEIGEVAQSGQFPPKCRICGKPPHTDSCGHSYLPPAETLRTSEQPSSETGVTLIARERQRQIEEEGFSLDGDQLQKNGELADAGACYAMAHRARALHVFPWAMKWWKPCPGDRVRELIKAGALIAAEIDRLLRAKSRRDRQRL